jgi:hypothetical protein
LICGATRCMACIDLICFHVSGISAARTVTVRAMIEKPQLKPMLSWKNNITLSSASMSGWKMLASGVITS